MKTVYTQHKKMICIVGVLLVAICAALMGAVIGIQYFYEDFVAAKEQIKDTLGIVTEADLALIAAQEAAEAQAIADAIAAEEAAAAQAEADEAATTEAYLASLLEGTDYRTITINGQAVQIDCMAETYTWFDASLLSTDQVNTFVFGDFSGYSVVFEGQAVAEGDVVSVSLDALGQGIGLSLTVTSEETGAVCYYFIRTLHSEYNSITTGEGGGDGYYYFASESNIYKMDMSGNIVFYKECDNIVCDFKQTIVDGVTYYSYIEFTLQGDDTVGATKYKGVILDENYQVIDTIDYLSTQDGMPENCSLDMHELLVLGEGHYMFASYVYQRVENVPSDICEDGVAYVQATVIQEIQDGELIFQWNSTDYDEFYGYSIRVARLAESSEELYVDYMHFNSIAFDPNDGNMILSFRSLSALVKIDRETGDIIWILGGEGDMFGLTEEEKMSYQHFPQVLEDGTITVFDNGTDYEQTRALEYVLDEENLTLIECNAYQIDGWYASARGSAICLDQDTSTYLMGWGQTAANNVVFTEINFSTGEVLFELMDLDYAEDGMASSYRVYKFDS